MFPFDLCGPDFLVLFLLLAVAAAMLAGLLRRQGDPGLIAAGQLDDPYLLAFLRGGRRHLLRVAVLSLIDRELLQYKAEVLRTPGVNCLNKSPRPLDQAILEHYLTPGRAVDVFQNARILARADHYEQQLADLDLLPRHAVKIRRLRLFLAVALPLLAIAVAKMIVAMNRGHSNIGMLIILALVSGVVIFKICTPFRTRAGSAALQQARDLFRGLKTRGKSLALHAPTNELVLLAAVFGVAVLPDAVAGILKPMKMYRESAAGSSCGSSCGSSSCGSSGCGGGCGGGGCGGCGS